MDEDDEIIDPNNDEYRDEDYQYEDEDYALNEIHSDEVEFIQQDEVNKKRKEQINTFIEASSLSEDDAELVLINFNWNLEKLLEDYFENIDKIQIQSGIKRDKISEKKTKADENQPNCLVCFDDLDSSNKIGLKCNHFFCVSCYKDYLKEKITNDPLTCCSINCPESKCNLIIPSSLVKKLLNNEEDKPLYQIYKKYLIKNFTDSNSDIKWCPNPLCGQLIRLPGHGMKDVTCILCKTVFCFKCLRNTHRPCDCEMMTIWEKTYAQNSEDIKWITENTKQCPKCGKFIQKNQGCNHMTCKCGHEFCWICLGDWSIHGSNFYNCTFQDKKAGYKQSKASKDQGVKNTEKFLKFVELYENHKHAIKCAKDESLKIKEFQEELLTKNIPYSDTFFLNDAFNTVLNARQILMNTYIYSYFLKENKRQGSLFEHHQILLDFQTDNLHEILENRFNRILAIPLNAGFELQFQQIRKEIIDKRSIITSYLDKLVKEIENNLSNVFEASRFKC